MRFMEYIALRQPKQSPELADLRNILIDTAVVPHCVSPKLPFGHCPSSEMKESTYVAIDAILASDDFSKRYHLPLKALQRTLDYQLCFQEGVRKYIYLELDAYFKHAFSVDPLLLHDLSIDNDKRVAIIGKATHWLICAYPPEHSVIDIFHEVNALFNHAANEYKSTLIHH